MTRPTGSRCAERGCAGGVVCHFGRLVVWGDMHLVTQGGELDAAAFSILRIHQADRKFPHQGSRWIRASREVKCLYNLVCNSCHQADGGGGVAQGMSAVGRL